MDLHSIIQSGAYITSSGTTGTPKKIYRSPDNIKICSEVACKVQRITKESSVYTVTRMTHAGGLLLQSVPAAIIGANVEISSFNPKTFVESFKRHTHTFLAPRMVESLIKTNSLQGADFSHKLITLGSDRIPDYHITELLNTGATVIANWGMSEIGPCVINKTFTLESNVKSDIMGNNFECDIDIRDDELFVKSEMCIHEGWFATGDLVEMIDGELFYRGRK